MQRIEAEWQTYLHMVVPLDAEQVQKDETKKAFFGGAVAIFDLLIDAAHLDHEAILKELAQELQVYKEQITKGII